MIRKILLIGIAASVLATGCNRQKIDKDVLAQVNGYKVMRAELEKSYNVQMAGSPHKLSPDEDTGVRLKIVRQLIDVQLQLQKAKKLGISASEDEINAKIKDAKAQYSESEFTQQLTKMGYTEAEYKQEVGHGLTINKLLDHEITSKVTTTDADIQAYYDQHRSEFNIGEPQYSVGQIYVTGLQVGPPGQIPGKAQTDAEAQQKIQLAYKSLKDGADFASVARRYSEDPNSRDKGGELGSMSESQLKKTDPTTQQAILKLQSGEYSQPIPVIDPNTHRAVGYRIVEVSKKEAAGQRDLSDPSVQQFIRNQVTQQKSKLLRAAYDEVLHEGADIHDYYAETILNGNAQK